MRTYVKNNKWYLTCKDQTGAQDTITVEFDFSKVFDWYPLCASYEVRYDNRSELFFITPRDYDHPRMYGVRQRRKEKADEVASFTKDSFYIKEVKEENEKVIGLAKAMGIPVAEDKPSKWEIKEGHERISELYDNPINESLLSKAYESMDEREWKKFINGDEEAKSIILHTYATPKERRLLRESGHFRVYLNLLRRGA